LDDSKNQQGTTEVDIYVGCRIRERRHELGMTQAELGRLSGVQFQQIQKYENGLNRVSSSRIWMIAKALGTPVGYFFEGFLDGYDPGTAREGSEHRLTGLLYDDDLKKLLTAYQKVPRKKRWALLQMAKTLAKVARDKKPNE
jgi:transcriptional regulator with XRE-family HTH domain